MEFSLGDLAERFGGEVHGDGACMIHAVATLEQAGPGEITFLANPHYRGLLAGTNASAVILAPRFVGDCPTHALVTDNPYSVYARVAQLLYPSRRLVPGVHRSACVEASSVLKEGVSIGANAVIGAQVRVGRDVRIGPGCVVEDGVEIGAGSTLVANVTVCHGSRIGERALIHPGVVIGADGFGFARDREGWIKIPQLGCVIIGDDVEVGANTTIDRGALEDTVIEEGVKLDNQIQVAHNVRIGAHTAIAGCTGIAGSTRIGRRCAIGGGVGILGHLEIADDVQITARTLVTHSITASGSYSSGTPLEATAAWRKNHVRMKQLDDMAKRLSELERLVMAKMDEDEPQRTPDEQ
ncbi:MAG: UDP-3-O-(3-hydroxymyristoyl)glucosamine N-acyltransferase [Gammaproteobacteria bacterium]|nr:UDP-3-O-(3-hydroxymyristoyl)glucosamine N-acyltransferase [Gammaproteobacteria bacterium]